MAEKNRYPQIPSTVWWGVRAILKRTPTATIDERLLGAQLDVQEAAARAYVAELKAVGILTDDGKATSTAQKWRMDDTYGEAAQELVAANYPEGLLHLAPVEEGDRQKIVNWFLREGLGQGAAGNKTATYLLIGSPSPNEAPSRANGRSPKENGDKSSKVNQRGNASPPKRSAAGGATRSSGSEPEGFARASAKAQEAFPLNVNVQIHISADAGSEQIESIFAAMRRYLYDIPNN
ncbi:hypothetical protein [Sinorhizobium chiapasense]|uniref:DUF5343 domain-containing protein n=1 Tax=Sinorhizobium chiapasense TaxID=501572 RepID=A0ABZ2B917_9HYPH